MSQRYANSDRRLDARSIMAVGFALCLMASMFWMAITGNKFCCDQKSLVGQLRKQIFEAGARPALL